jgi:hypothetical protein
MCKNPGNFELSCALLLLVVTSLVDRTYLERIEIFLSIFSCMDWVDVQETKLKDNLAWKNFTVTGLQFSS